MEIQAPFNYKEELRRYKREVLNPAVAQYVRENPDISLPEIARRFGLTETPIWQIASSQGVKRGSGRRKKVR